MEMEIRGEDHGSTEDVDPPNKGRMGSHRKRLRTSRKLKRMRKG
jgi:hypothetical protein